MKTLLVLMLLSAATVVWADANDANSFMTGLANGLNYGLYGNRATDNSAQMEMLREQENYQRRQLQIQQEQLEIQRQQLQAQQQENNQREWWYNK